MFPYILVPATGAETDGPVFATALAVARQSGAHLEFLHVRIDVERAVMAMAATDMGGGTGYDEIIETLEQDVASRMRVAEAAFQAFCTQAGLAVSREPGGSLPSAEWRVESGHEPTWLAQRGRAADLIVIGRARGEEAVAMDVLQAALMESGRPVLIAPATAPARIAETVVIAWKNTPEAAHAVAAAQPFLRAAERVVILTIDESGRHDEQSSEALRHALLWQAPNTTVRRLTSGDGAPVETLLAAAAAAKAGLLVMGGYGHSRMREVVFGGFTRHILNGADLPVLMAH
ncbi:MAG: universal stress protein [Acetobacteraceae bacterium]|nr:universal stress protein [Acetobacteraceae bacterium]